MDNKKTFILFFILMSIIYIYATEEVDVSYFRNYFYRLKLLGERYKIDVENLTIGEIEEEFEKLIEPPEEKLVVIPEFKNMKYGKYKDNLIDIWTPEVSGKKPVFVYFHGGSFITDDKKDLPKDLLKKCLENGIIFASANYRTANTAPYPAAMYDALTVVKYLRKNSDFYEIDEKRIAVGGNSSGGTLALWLATHDDVSLPDYPGSIANISGKICGALCIDPITSVDPFFISRVISEKGLFIPFFLPFYNVINNNELRQQQIRLKISDANPYSNINRGDYPVYMEFIGDVENDFDGNSLTQGKILHHANLGEYFYKKYKKANNKIYFYYKGNPAPKDSRINFIKEAIWEADR
ncbi:MAG: hypothetical protein C0601_05690 [Candidatus Muiribacterium halophilum]|uniref:BD-FAE-like domain-containing protein n=1 Tax=Muiribacterium halophilum TaxID=2053465 RepID=A0A2N5ZHG3_MUIH1|nr:MAG: hypothetical protein C0601_05690 [Candidatus Muirbacterium halophilum]